MSKTGIWAAQQIRKAHTRHNPPHPRCPLCRVCALDHDDEVARQATWLMPQSIDAGKTITFILVCDGHHKEWWDGADWDGRHLERRI